MTSPRARSSTSQRWRRRRRGNRLCGVAARSARTRRGLRGRETGPAPRLSPEDGRGAVTTVDLRTATQDSRAGTRDSRTASSCRVAATQDSRRGEGESCGGAHESCDGARPCGNAADDLGVHRSVDTHVVRDVGRSVDCADAAAAASSGVSDSEPGRPDGETEMTTMSTPYATTHPFYADDDTLRLPPATIPTADRRPAARSSTPPGCGPAGSRPPPSRRSSAWSAPS